MARQRVESDHDLLSSYLREIARYPQLTVEEERELARRIRDGDGDALEELVRCNLRFVVSYAKKFRTRDIQFLDLIEEGNLGLMEAAKRFDPGRDVKFITYAVWWIRQAILQALAEQTRAFRVPPRQASLLNKLEKAISASLEADEGIPSPEDLAVELDVSVDEINTLLDASGTSQSLSDEVATNVQLEELIEQSLIDAADDVYQRLDQREQLLSELDQLSDRERLVLMLRYGVGDDSPQSIATLANLFETDEQTVATRLNEGIEEVCRKLDISPGELSHLLLYRNSDAGANWQFWIELDDHPKGESAAVDPQRRDALLEINRSARTQEVVGQLEPLPRALLLLRYGILEDESFTLQEIGDMLGISRERVRQIESKAESRCRRIASRSSERSSSRG